MNGVHYYNFQHTVAESRWERRAFLHEWWRLARSDPRWSPPEYGLLRKELNPRHNSHLARMNPVFVYNQAIVRPRSHGQVVIFGPWMPGSVLANAPFSEVTLSAAVLLSDSRRSDGAACLALMECANALEGPERLLEELTASLQEQEVTKIIAPTGLSPYLGSGLLQDSWDRQPPLHTPYQPPYMVELVAVLMEPFASARLYHLPVESAARHEAPGLPGLQIVPLDFSRLPDKDFLALFQAACPAWAGFPSPDEAEARFLLRWVSCQRLQGWLAQVEEQPAGFVLLQADLSREYQRAHGGRGLPGWLWLRFAGRLPAREGRILFGGVLPEWRGRGIGSRLLEQARLSASTLGWHSLSVGPIPTELPAGPFLERSLARPGQTYLLYEKELI